MFFGIVFLLFLSGVVHSTPHQFPSEQELEVFARSHTWLSLYVYKRSKAGFKSKATEDKFFFHKEGKHSPILELKAAIRAFKSEEKLWGHIGKPAHCAFPARFSRLKQKWPHIFPEKRKKCDDLIDWLERIDAKSISLVYAGPYPNNPASMFGHSLLRVHRNKGSDLLDYNIAFQAMVDPRDDAVSYTLKGIFGGYPGFYQIHPYYENIGLYSNSESRDLWEYRLHLAPEQINFFMMHLWEVSLNTGFNYYFLDENCSYYLLTLLEAVTGDNSLTEGTDLVVHPIETIKLAVRNINSDHRSSSVYRPAIQRRINKRLRKLNNLQRLEYKRAKKGVIPQDAEVLDALIEYWKHRTYTFRGKLKSAENKIMLATYAQRAKINKQAERIDIPNSISPIQVHSPAKVEMRSYAEESPSIRFDLGYHGLGDDETGITRWSFIEFLGAEIQLGREPKVKSLNLFDIYSLEHFSLHDKEISWRGSVSAEQDPDFPERLIPRAEGGLGFTYDFSGRMKMVNWLLALLRATPSGFEPLVQYGLKSQWRSSVFTLKNDLAVGTKRNNELTLMFNYYLKVNLAASINYVNSYERELVSGGIKYHF